MRLSIQLLDSVYVQSFQEDILQRCSIHFYMELGIKLVERVEFMSSIKNSDKDDADFYDFKIC